MDFEKYFEKKSPITEQSNEITKNIDLASETELVELFRQTDKELFEGWTIEDHVSTRGLTDDALLDKVDSFSRLIANEIEKNQSSNTRFKVVLSGCGTSGRLAYLCAQSVNEHLGRDLCSYIIAGGDYALIHSVEAVEDSPKSGQEAFEGLIEDTDRVVLIAITCGLSAPFVAGQLQFFLNNNPKIAGVALIGFNTASLARTNPIYFEASATTHTFSSILTECLAKPNFFLLNPLIGPEPITGSSRMKSGSATKILLDLIFAPLFKPDVSSHRLLTLFKESISDCIYGNESNSRLLADILTKSAAALKQQSSVNYVSDRKRNAILCCIDASECLPTFGAELSQIRGFVDARQSEPEPFWNTIDMFEECGVASVEFKSACDDPKAFFVEVNHAEESLVPRKENKMSLRGVIEALKEFVSEQDLSELSGFLVDALLFINLKICLNIISTGSFVKFGKVYRNYMIDVKASNRKLYLRAIGLIKLLTGEDYDKCEMCLLKSIYMRDEISGVNIEDVSKHIETAKGSKFVVPRALIMCATGCCVDEATKELENSTAIRNSIEAILKKRNHS